MTSKVESRRYRIFAAKPIGPAPDAGNPVVYVLDGNAVFSTAVEAVRLQGRHTVKTMVTPAIVNDFTLSPESTYANRWNGRDMPPNGGSNVFLRFIEEELKPEIGRRFAVDASRQAIFGHLLGGLFVLHAKFTKPESFRNYISCSPSVHWAKEHLYAKEETFIGKVKEQPANLDCLISMGELERGHFTRSVELAEELAARLSGLTDYGVRVQYKEFENENHGSVLLVLISRALRLALRPRQDKPE